MRQRTGGRPPSRAIPSASVSDDAASPAPPSAQRTRTPGRDTANLTPDPETGLGRWTADDFVMTIRSGRHLGRGRPILPPMPLPQPIRNLTDDDLRAVFAYLQTLPPIVNDVPDPVLPAGADGR